MVGGGTSRTAASTAAGGQRAGGLSNTKVPGFYPDKVLGVELSSLEPAKCTEWKGDLLALAVYEDDLSAASDSTSKSISSERLAAVDKSLQGFLAELLSFSDFSGKAGSSSFARFGGSARLVGLVGLGPAKSAQAAMPWGRSPFQEAGLVVATAAAAHKASKAAIAVLGSDSSSISSADVVEKLAVGVATGAYKSSRFKAKPALSPLSTVELLVLGAEEAALKRAAAIAKGVLLARGLIEAPPNVATPQHLADAAASIAASAPDCMKLEVLEKEQCLELGMGLYLGVAEASDLPPKFIHLTYTPPGKSNKTVGLVGKGLTTDTGGYNLKVGVGIEMMKWDMGGCGAVLGAAQAIAGIKPEGVTVHFISATCENMIDGKGLHPGDILTSPSGKTVEVDNTDAEGRLTLADALWFAQEKCGVEAVVDIATLTGACMIALGKQVAGMFTPSDALAADLTAASRSSGEKLWRMPLEESYLKILDSPIADLKNTGVPNRFGGAITAALFIREFVDTEKVEWGHLDIAGTAWDDSVGGATGFGVGTLAEWAINHGKA